MKNILITGAEGQLGRTLQNLPPIRNMNLFFVNKETLDITDKDSIDKLFSISNFDYCINCAAYTDVELAETEPEKAFKVNAEGVENLAKSCEKHSVILIHISTDYVFDGEKDGPYLTTDTPNPINEYGRSKLEGEWYITELMSRFYIVRTSWLYSDFAPNFYTKIRDKAKNGEQLRVTDEQRGCPTHTKQLAGFLVNLISGKRKEFGIYHFTGGVPMTWYQWAVKIVSELGLNASDLVVKDSNYRTFASRPENSVLG